MGNIVDHKVKLVAQPFGNLKYRDKSVLILCKDNKGKFILGAKMDHYPPNIVRLVGGGVNENETVTEAAIRELKEEMNITVENNSLIPLIQVNITGEYYDTTYKTQIHIFYYKLANPTYVAGDDITGIVRYSEEEYQKLIMRYFALNDEQMFIENGDAFSWGDYGKVYGYIHRIALDELRARNL